MRKGKVVGWTIKIWYADRKNGVYVDTTSLPDDVSQGIDDWLTEEFETPKKENNES